MTGDLRELSDPEMTALLGAISCDCEGRTCHDGCYHRLFAAVERIVADRVAELERRIGELADEARQRQVAYPSHPHFEAWRMYEADLRDLVRGEEVGSDD